MNPVAELAALDKTIHQPTRLAIITTLYKLRQAQYLYLRKSLGLSAGNLSTHLKKLEEAGLIGSGSGLGDDTPRTLVWLTPHGRRRIHSHWRFMHSADGRVRDWARTEGREAYEAHLYSTYGG